MTNLRFRVRAALVLQTLIIPATLLATANSEPAIIASNHPVPGGDKPPEIKLRVMEGYPTKLQARLEQRQRTFRNLAQSPTGHAPRFIINLSKRWQPGQTLRVAFRGGDDALRKDIADTVADWTKYANLKLDFVDPATGNARTWSKSDTQFVAEIRVSFDQSGYYSLVGNDSTNPLVTKAGEESLNLEGFDRQRPSDWKAVALHEFGHAIGFEHEHQSPVATCDFRFDDDPGYVATTDQFGQYIPDSQGKRPGLYTLLGGPPNNWPQAVVDFNLKQLPESHAYAVGSFDKDSIMKYFFEDWMFSSGTQSPCYTSSENRMLSSGDKEGAAKVYPRSPELIKASAELRAKALGEIMKIKNLPAATQQHLQQLKRDQDK
jgi:hypothetical protein